MVIDRILRENAIPGEQLALLRRRLRRDREHQGGRRPGRRRGQRRGQQRLGPDRRVEARAPLGRRRRRRHPRLSRRDPLLSTICSAAEGLDDDPPTPLDLGRLQGPPAGRARQPDPRRRHPDRSRLDAPPPCSEPVADQIRRAAPRKHPRGPRARGGGDPDLRRPPAAQRRGADPRADDGRRLAHAPGHQRRRHDPRLGIRLARPLDRERSRTTSPPARSAPGTRPAATSTSPCWPAASTARATARPLGRFIAEDGATLPSADELAAADPRRARAIRSRRPAPTALLAIVQHGIARGPDHGRAPLEARLDPRPGLPARRADDRPSGHRLRHHRQSSDVQRRRRSAGPPSSTSSSSAARSRPSTAASCSRSARRSWGRRSSRRA